MRLPDGTCNVLLRIYTPYGKYVILPRAAFSASIAFKEAESSVAPSPFTLNFVKQELYESDLEKPQNATYLCPLTFLTLTIWSLENPL